MFPSRTWLLLIGLSLLVGAANPRWVGGQEPTAGEDAPPRPPKVASRATASAAGAAATPAGKNPSGWAPARGATGLSGLPSSQGQSWREWDLRDYTSSVTTTVRPEQAVIDWILRETGTEVWFTEPLGVLNADRDTLRVYHAPEMHQLIDDVVQRFVRGPREPQAFGLRLVTVGNPNWRSRAVSLMQSVAVQSPGVDAWLLTPENAALLLTDLRRRADFQEHQAPNVAIFNGQSQTISRLHPRNYVRSVQVNNSAVGFELDTAQIQEGYSLQVSPLISVDGKTVDAVVKCHIDQVEKLIPVPIEVPGNNRQPVKIQVPQLVSWRLHERFRWPADNILVLSCGVVAVPTESTAPSRPLPMLSGVLPQRADAILFIEYKGAATAAALEASRSTDRANTANRGRY